MQLLILLLVGSYILIWPAYFAISRETWVNKIANCLITTACIVVLLGFFELPAVLGLIDYGLLISPRKSLLYTRIKPWDNRWNHFDRELIHIHRPGQRFLGKAQGDLVYWLGIRTDRRYEVAIQYDSHGFRNDREIAQADIVVIGDSFAEAGLVPQADLVSTRLRHLLQVEVANLGQSGYGPQQELLVLSRYGLPLRPKIVAWLFFEGNDLLDVQRYEQFRRNPDSLLRRRESFTNRSFTRNALLALGAYIGPDSQTDDTEAHKRSCRFSRAQSDEAKILYFAYAGSPLSEKELESLDTARNLFLEAHELTAKYNATLLFVYVPTKFRVYDGLCEYSDNSYARAWQLNDLPQRLERWCKVAGIPYLDLTGALREAATRGELVYFPDDGHWTSKGHEIAAATIARSLEANGWLRGPALRGRSTTASN